ncbi:MAG TPA: ATP-binding protein [Anaerolineaceae bacterium]|nr:ATP-binding protein [Anaerolineaceae bacterium]
MADHVNFLRKVPLFADLPLPDLVRLCGMVEEVHLPAGELLFVEGSLGQKAYVIREGQVEIYKTANGKQVQLAVRQPGDVIGEMALLVAAPRSASGRALTDSFLIALSAEQLNELLDTSPKAARTLLHTITSRLSSMEMLLRQNEKMAALGTFTAGIAHELNNPSSAVSRGVEQLGSVVDRFQRSQWAWMRLDISPEQASYLDEIRQRGRQQALSPGQLDLVTRGDQEADLEDWLDENKVEDAWELAPQLVNLGYDTAFLDELRERLPADGLPVFLHWIVDEATLFNLLHEIGQGATRMQEIIKALKSYAYLDQAPIQAVDIHEGLDNTLVILRHKLKQGVEIIREYDPQLPRIQAYGSELNQVWTNIIDNAVDAMEGKGRITLRTAYRDPWLVVEIEDNGPGILAEVQGKIFDPFFTTKPLGKGTGLGLNISYNIVHKHFGDITVDSRPGKTRFVIHLPVNFEEARVKSGASQPQSERS